MTNSSCLGPAFGGMSKRIKRATTKCPPHGVDLPKAEEWLRIERVCFAIVFYSGVVLRVMAGKVLYRLRFAARKISQMIQSK